MNLDSIISETMTILVRQIVESQWWTSWEMSCQLQQEADIFAYKCLGTAFRIR